MQKQNGSNGQVFVSYNNTTQSNEYFLTIKFFY